MTGEADETGRRIKRARDRRDRLDDCFLLLYCDNYLPLRMKPMWERFAAAGVPAMVTVYVPPEGSGRTGNVRIDGDGFVTVYDKSAGPGASGGSRSATRS